jgi:outer membrane lipoprotein-sorting protein
MVNVRRIHYFCCCLLAVFLAPLGVFGQEIVTAERYLERVSDAYAGFKDYEARITIHSGTTEMRGTVSHRFPSFLRIDFTTPASQVIVFNGNTLTVYLPEHRAILNQSVDGNTSGAALASSQGLSLLRRNYAASFITGPEPVALEEGSRERVVKLHLTRRYGNEGFREITLSIDPSSLLIRRMEGITIADVTVRFDFQNIQTNIGIPEQRFLYDSPASANMYNNFLFRDTH